MRLGRACNRGVALEICASSRDVLGFRSVDDDVLVLRRSGNLAQPSGSSCCYGKIERSREVVGLDCWVDADVGALDVNVAARERMLESSDLR